MASSIENGAYYSRPSPLGAIADVAGLLFLEPLLCGIIGVGFNPNRERLDERSIKMVYGIMTVRRQVQIVLKRLSAGARFPW
ncbi:MAG TPA: hypothetical protein PKD64_16595 [Pirellulaceae bacterium]|nr:hypothetical protein [Pirellulaceae bacterium]HMO93810.1 hypothetical protein [Pirellulaceae bacterium]HMP70596.1 hypothetical protein [Pirellulaceae bacterium]